MATDNRRTVYAITVYPDSTDIDRMIRKVKRLHIASALSPLHDSDTYEQEDVEDYEERKKDGNVDEGEEAPEVGKPKKPHYHWMISFGRTKKSVKQVLDIVHTFAPTVKWVQPIYSWEKYLQYFCHQNDPDKAQYAPADVRGFCGADLSPLWAVTDADCMSALGQILNWVRMHSLYNWDEVVDVVMEIGNASQIQAMRQNQYLIKSYCDSIYEKSMGKRQSFASVNEVVKKILGNPDPVTGEIAACAA